MKLALAFDDAPLAQALKGLATRAENLSPLMADLAGYLETRADERFETETGPGGGAWPPSLRAKLTGGKTLTDKAQLRGSIVSQSDASSAEVGTNVIYAAIHQFGGTIKAKNVPQLAFRLASGAFVKTSQVNIPARPFLGFDEEDSGEILALSAKYLGAGLPGVAAAGGAP